MVSQRLTRRVLSSLFGAMALLATVVPGNALPPNDPGAFWPLVAGLANQPYTDALPGGASYTLRAGQLPPGLRLDASGQVTGIPTRAGLFEPVLEAVEPSGRRYDVRLSLTVRAPGEPSLHQPVRSFRSQGPYPTTQDTFTVDLSSNFDPAFNTQQVRNEVLLTRPVGTNRAPLLLFHRGRGFDEDSYHLLHQHLASYGIAVASIEDRYSFAGASFSADNRYYDLYRAELGMMSASALVESMADWLLTRSQDPGDSLYDSFDATNLFFAGHSRGGGAVHGSHQRAWELRLKGLIYLMPFDLRYFEDTAPPARAPAYSIYDQTPRTPSLVVCAENDGDLIYPIADQLIDRATGPTTQVTIHGAVHNLISDAHPSEGNDRISRREQRIQVADWIVCFIQRWAFGQTDLDRRLYGDGHHGDDDVAVASWFPQSHTIALEDAQDVDTTRNLSGPNLVAGLRRSERSTYPFVGGDYDSLGLRHTHLSLIDQVSVWRLGHDLPLNVSEHHRLVLRISQTSAAGWGWVGFWVRLVDAKGNTAWRQVWEPSRGGAFPAPSSLSPHDRFMDVHIDLDTFSPQSAGFDLAELRATDLVLVIRDPNTNGQVVVDQVRYE